MDDSPEKAQKDGSLASWLGFCALTGKRMSMNVEEGEVSTRVDVSSYAG